MNARSLTSITGFSYENVRKLLQRMVHAREPQLVSPARGLYTTLGHPCLAKPAAANVSTPPAEPPVPTVASVPDEPPLAAAQETPPQTPVPIVPTSPATPDPEHVQEAGSQTAPASSVSTVPGVSTTPETPDPANDQDTNSQATPVPSAPTVPTSGSSQPPAAAPPHPQPVRLPLPRLTNRLGHGKATPTSNQRTHKALLIVSACPGAYM
jgi:hypothetical protein